ncbi:MAG: DUF1329 domain-containing protein [Candidatus Latescibacteria bacterium]|nr:DUF1329 domain-containing protein [Candidatus Latescibacterota bacterium]
MDKTNVDQVAEFLPEVWPSIYKNGKAWGSAEGFPYFYIKAYEQYVPVKGVIESTKKYAPTVTLDGEGNIENYAEIAGVPFPDAKTGIEVAWNFDLNSFGDASNYFMIGPNITPGNTTERTARSDYVRLYWIHRASTTPKPKFEKNPKGIHHGLFMHMYNPPENKNSRYFNVRYIDHTKGDDGYIYYAPFRRLRRMGAATRTDTIDGTDLIYDDGNQWDGHIQQNTYKYLGEKELLCARNVDVSKYVRAMGEVMGSEYARERVKLLMVEAINKDPNYLYSKRLWYFDPESNYIPWQEIWDELGRMWKCVEYRFTIFKTEQGEMEIYPTSNSHNDFQRIHGGFSRDDIKRIGQPDINPKLFTIRSIQQFTY